MTFNPDLDLKTLERDPADLEAIIQTVRDNLDAFNPTRFPSHTYEDGVIAALEWVLGITDAPPFRPEGEDAHVP